MDLAERVSALRRINRLSARELAALAGVAPTTINRIEAGKVSPSFDLAQTILMVLGEPVSVGATADRAAIAAARAAVDPESGMVVTRAAEAWLDRWARLGLVTEDYTVAPGREADLLFRASTVARLARREGAVDCLPTTDWRSVARRMADGEVEYALTGDAAANLYLDSAAEQWPVFYVEDLDIAIDVTELEPRRSGTYGNRITLIPFDGVCEVGRIELDGVTVADENQVVIDCYGGTGRMAEQADALMSGETL